MRRIIDHGKRSERRACALMSLSRDAYRHPPQVSDSDQLLQAELVQLAHERPRFGYRRLALMVQSRRTEVINVKRVRRLYCELGLMVRKREKAKLTRTRRPLLAASHENQVWSLDFVSDRLATGRRIKILAIADDFSHESVDLVVDHGISGAYVARVLDQAANFRGYPQAIRTDNGPEFTSKALLYWVQQHGIRHYFIEPGKPMQNGYIESFNGKFRDECLNMQWFTTLYEARCEIQQWRRDYNEVRPHSSCGNRPPSAFAALHRTQTGGQKHDAKQLSKTDR